VQPISRTILTLAVAHILSLGLATSSHAASITTAVEIGGDVVFTTAAGGSLNLTGLNPEGSANRSPAICPSCGFFAIGAGDLTDDYVGAISAPSNFGVGGVGFPSEGSGPFLHIENGFLAVSQFYISGNILGESTALFAAETFATLGITPGTYVWVLPSSDTVTLNVVSAVPVPAAAWLFGSALGLLGWMRRKAT
jgi:hypothetical protein